MHIVTSFHASRVGPEQMTAIVADYLALERTRTFRRRLTICVGALAVCLGVGAGCHWLSTDVSWFTTGLWAAAAAVAWLVELRCDRRLARRLTDVPGSTEEVLRRRQKVIKSS